MKLSDTLENILDREKAIHKAVDKLIADQDKGGVYWDMMTLEDFVQKVCRHYDPEFII